jgi:hypothetical protein
LLTMSFLHIIFSLFFSRFFSYLPEYISYVTTFALELLTAAYTQ